MKKTVLTYSIAGTHARAFIKFMENTYLPKLVNSRCFEDDFAKRTDTTSFPGTTNIVYILSPIEGKQEEYEHTYKNQIDLEFNSYNSDLITSGRLKMIPVNNANIEKFTVEKTVVAN